MKLRLRLNFPRALDNEWGRWGALGRISPISAHAGAHTHRRVIRETCPHLPHLPRLGDEKRALIKSEPPEIGCFQPRRQTGRHFPALPCRARARARDRYCVPFGYTVLARSP